MPYLEDVLPEDADTEFDPETDLLEVIGDQQPGGGNTFSPQISDATIVYQIPFLKQRSFVRWVNGFSCVDAGDVTRIYRENPPAHPMFPRMYAYSCNITAFPPKAEDGVLYISARFTGDGWINRQANYEVCYATVKFRKAEWEYLPNGRITSPADEIERNAFVDVVPTVEMLSAESELGQLRWAEGGGANQPTVGKPVPAPFGTLVSKSTIVLHWMSVPELWLSAEGGTAFFPENLFAPIGMVNSAEFMGYAAGTLLMQPPKLSRFQWDVATLDGTGGYFAYDLAIPFQYFNPTKGTGSSARGFQLMPWPATLTWFEATRADGVTHLLQEADFNDIFDPVT